MTKQPNHRLQAESWLEVASEHRTAGHLTIAQLDALLGIGHALLAQDHNRCTATRGHANGHHYPAEPRLVGDWEEHTDPPRCKNCGHYEGHRFHRVTEAEEFHPYVPVTADTRCDQYGDGLGQCLNHMGHQGDHQWPAESVEAIWRRNLRDATGPT